MDDTAGRTNPAYQKAKRVYYATCWLPLTLFVFACISPETRLYPYENVIKTVLAGFLLAGIGLIVWGLRLRSSMIGLVLALVPGCLILLWFVTSINYIHFLQGPDQTPPQH